MKPNHDRPNTSVQKVGNGNLKAGIVHHMRSKGFLIRSRSSMFTKDCAKY
jgi:hypothetical protein